MYRADCASRLGTYVQKEEVRKTVDRSNKRFAGRYA